MKQMKVLMLGWEYPPHITGGLGTACHGLLRGLRENGETSVHFVLPKLLGGEDAIYARLLAAEDFDVVATDDFASTLDESETSGDYLSDTRPTFGRGKWPSCESVALRRHFEFCLSHAASRDDPHLDTIVADRRVVPVARPPELGGGVYQGHSIMGALAYASRVDAIVEHVGQTDVIHAHDWLTFLAGVRAKSLTGRPLIAHVHSTEIDRAGERYNHDIFNIERFGLAMADKIVAVSEYTRRHIVERYEIPPHKISVVRNGANELASSPHASAKCSDGYDVAFVGRMTSQKGPRYFVEAAVRVLERIGPTKFVMAGTGDLLPMIRALVAAKGVDEHFAFPGFLNARDVHQLLAKSKVYVMPSVSEPFGIGALEAVHAGVPVVLSDRTGVAEVLESAVKVRAFDSNAIADAIVSLLRDPDRARKLAAMAKQEIRQLTWKRSASTLLSIYRSLL
jgi:glycosyltransferase involved in cell wall biosynthesis